MLFKFDENLEFAQLTAAPSASPKRTKDDILRRRLIEYKLHHPSEDIRKACDVLLKSIEGLEKLRFIPLGDETERLAMQLALSRKIEGDKRYFFEIIAEIKALLANDKLL